MNAENSNSTKKQHWYKSPWLLGWLFLLLTVLVVNIYMILQSMNKFPGLVVNDFYERGQNYEDKIKEKLANNAKWKPNFILSPVQFKQETIIKFSITDLKGNAVNIDKLTLFAYRPSDATQDFSQAMIKTEQANTYETHITFHHKGKWDLLASVIIDGIEVNYAQKLFVND